MGRETQGRGRQTVTLPPPPPPPPLTPRRVPRRMTSKGGRSGGLKDLETGQVASRAVPVPGPMADPGTQVATADRELRVTMADPGTRTAMADRVYAPPPKIFLGGLPAGEYPVRTGGDEGELGGASGDEGKLDETNFRGRSGSADSLGRW